MKNWEALRELMAGTSVRHGSWPISKAHICAWPEACCEHYHVVPPARLFDQADGWEIYTSDEPAGHDFKWAVDQLLDGKAVSRKTWSASNGLVLRGSLCAVWKGWGCIIRKEDLAAHDWVLYEEARR